MHWDKTAARIILILSVVDVAIATPATVRQRSQDVDEDVTPASEKRANPGDTPQDVHPVPQMDNVPTTSGILPSQDPSPESGTQQLYNDPTATSEAPPSQDDTSPAPGDPPYHNDPPAGSEDPQLQSDSPSASGVNSDPPSTSEILPEHDDLSSGTSGSGESDYGLNDGEGAPSGSHVNSELPAANEDLRNAMKDKLLLISDIAIVTLGYAGIAYSIGMVIKHHTHKAYVSALFPPSPADI